MYVPAHFAVTDLPVLHDFIESHPFGLLVTVQDGRPFVTHLPFVVDRGTGPYGALRGHVARQNPQWQSLAAQDILVVFNGPHAYVSPTWYAAEKVVPTWNYVAVHVYGRARVMESADELIGLLSDLTAASERGMPDPWAFDPADPFVRKLADQVVGFEIAVDVIEGKWKLNQNHPPERRRRVAAALREQGYDDAREIARLIEGT
jgi:transcriptional regulator